MVGVGWAAALPRRIKRELLFDPFSSSRPPEKGLIATGFLLLRLTALRELQDWARTDGSRAFLSPLRAMPPPPRGKSPGGEMWLGDCSYAGTTCDCRFCKHSKMATTRGFTGRKRAGGCRVSQDLRNTPATQGANSLQKRKALHLAIFPYRNPYHENDA